MHATNGTPTDFGHFRTETSTKFSIGSTKFSTKFSTKILVLVASARGYIIRYTNPVSDLTGDQCSLVDQFSARAKD